MSRDVRDIDDAYVIDLPYESLCEESSTSVLTEKDLRKCYWVVWHKVIEENVELLRLLVILEQRFPGQ